MKKALTFAVCTLVMMVAREAAAQPLAWTDRVYVNLNGGFESGSEDLNDTATRRVYGEDATFSSAQSVDSGGIFDFGAGARVWRNATVGIAYHQGSSSGDAAVQGAVPHPLFFNQPRSFSATVPDLERTERAVHLQFGYMILVTEDATVHVTVGPSFFKLRQDVVSDVTFSEVGAPFTSVTANPVVTEREDSPVGFNIGVDVAYQFYEVNRVKLGAGVLLRYTAATADLQLLQNTVESDLGGFQFGIGARIRF
jgi:hypothetical protein